MKNTFNKTKTPPIVRRGVLYYRSLTLNSSIAVLRASLFFLKSLLRSNFSIQSTSLLYSGYFFASISRSLSIALSIASTCFLVSIDLNSSLNNSASSIISFTKEIVAAFLSASVFKTVVTNCYHIYRLLSFKVLVEEINSSTYIISCFLKTNVYAHFWRNPCLKSLKKTCQVHFFEVVPSKENPSLAFCSKFVIFNPKIKLYQTI